MAMPMRVAAGVAGGLIGGVVFGVLMQMMDRLPMVAMLVGSDSMQEIGKAGAVRAGAIAGQRIAIGQGRSFG